MFYLPRQTQFNFLHIALLQINPAWDALAESAVLQRAEGNQGATAEGFLSVCSFSVQRKTLELGRVWSKNLMRSA